jgi:hypothetical protein
MANTYKKTVGFSLKTKILLYILLILLILILHYPMSYNEIGWDSFAIHILANSLSEFGYAKWWLHPLSIFGMYPYGDISGAVPFFISGISQITVNSSDISIFWVSLFLGIFSIFTAYMMAGVIFDNEIYKFLVAFGYSTSQGILFYTTWTAGTRALFIVMLPLFIYFLMKSADSIKYILLTLVLFLVLISTHKMFYFSLPLIFGFVLIQIIYKLKQYISVNQLKYFNLIFLFGFLFTFMIPFFTRTFIEIGSRYEWLNELFITYIRYNGAIIIFALSGYVYILLNDNKTRREYFLLTSLILIAPLMYIITYMKWFILPFIYMTAGVGLWNVLRSKQILKVFPLLFVIIILFSGYYQFIHYYTGTQSEERGIDESIYSAAIWSKESILRSHNMVGQDTSISERMFSISNIPTMIGTDTDDLVYGFIDKNNINITRRSAISFDAAFDSPYIDINALNKPRTVWFFENTFIYKTIQDAKWVFLQFNISYIIENTNTQTFFLNSLHQSKNNNLYYDNGKIKIWDSGLSS